VSCNKLGQIEGVSFWETPSFDSSIKTINLIRSGVVAGPAKFGLNSTVKILAIIDQLEGQREKVMGKQLYWTLHLVSVRPEFQKKGIGKYVFLFMI
jgi:hypothetical protein